MIDVLTKAEREVVETMRAIKKAHRATMHESAMLVIIDRLAAVVERQGEVERAVQELATYDDFGEPMICGACKPRNPEGINKARQRVHNALQSLHPHPQQGT